jgi:hypothetical protein
MGIRQYVRSAVLVARTAEETRRRAFTAAAPPKCPPGWRTGPPDFVGVGIQKAGTTWWSRAVFSHPDILKLARKELRFFSHNWNEEFTDAEVAAYHRYFPRTGHEVSGEWTPRYMFDPWTPRRLHQAAPDARILVILRDPVARLRSGMRHLAFHYPGEIHPRMVDEAIEFGRYAGQLARLTEHFPRQQILVLQFEKCLENAERELARTYRFIAVDPAFVPADLHEPANEGQGPPVTVPSDLIDVARSLYRADAERLRAEWPEIDLDLWPSVAGS